MIFERFFLPGLGHASYALGCPRSKEIAILDPRRDVEIYLEFAAASGLRITHVLETHIHADYASGASELAERTGAAACVSAYDLGERFEVSFPHRDLHDRESLSLGDVRIEVLATPGHTPEHIAFLVYDTARLPDFPAALLSGDLLFAGAVGRPDLLGEEAALPLARAMYDSLHRRIEGLSDSLEVHPAHGAGTLCGSGLDGRTATTLGYERRANPFLDRGLSRDAFCELLLLALPPRPEHFGRMKRLNAAGAPPPPPLLGLSVLTVEAVLHRWEDGAIIVDVRDQAAFAAGHIPGAINLGSGPLLSQWAGWILPAASPLVLVAADPAQAEAAARSLVRVGLDLVAGRLGGGFEAWRRVGLPVARLPQIGLDAALARQASGELRILDVRYGGADAEDRVQGALRVAAAEIEKARERLLGCGGGFAVVCNTGYVSTLAASLMMRAGFQEVSHVSGGVAAWKEGG